MIYPNTATLEPEQLSVLLEEYRKHNFIDPEVSEKLGVKRGLRNPDGTGVLAGLTSICDVQGYITNTDGSITPSKGHLIYRGYDIDDFAKEADALQFKGAVVDGTYYDVDGVKVLATIPSKDVLISKLLGSLQSPVTNFARVIKQIAEAGDGETAEVAEEPAAE